MKVFIIGATGYVGSHVVKELIAHDHEVIGFCRNQAGSKKLETHGARAFIGDINNREALMSVAIEADATVFSPQIPNQEHEQEIVMDLLTTYAHTDKAFIFTSGTGVLAQRTNGQWSEDTFAEDDIVIPSKIVRTRYITEQLTRNSGYYDCRAMVIRPPNIWGEGVNGMAKLIADSVEKTGYACYVGSGLNLYTDVHVKDLAILYRLALERGTGGSLYHAAAGETSNRFLAEVIAGRMGVKTRSITIDAAFDVWGKFYTLVGMSASSRSRSPISRRELGWKPRYVDMPKSLLEDDYDFFGNH
ncbi:NAD-dependent epimerase/dehydratase family protein [Pseudomaricurvus alkylphenolicus]|uniref:NAD-dependent epimerase/dehydratase family protein n=1 Tax=Pseudomaricurvus alkylphenolicus TaxID=1306991 RepID=UPI001421D2A8|nr:NAD-dependent epimerase/dehydratase family protein [Pseudomaricurvus alkylphenolicus]